MIYKNKVFIFIFSIFAIFSVSMHFAHAASGEVLMHQKISDLEGNFSGVLNDGNGFGADIALLGDINNDGLNEIAVGAVEDVQGAIWILSLNSDGTVQSTLQKIGNGLGQFTGALDPGDLFGEKIVSLGDMDDDGVTDIAVGAHRDDDGGSDRGAVWILFLNANGTVKSHQKISDTQGNFNGSLSNSDDFGIGLTSLGDINGDTIVDLAVGAYRDDDGGTDTGAVWILFLNADGTVKSHQKISTTNGSFLGGIDPNDRFGVSVSGLGDLDADNVPDVAVGAGQDDDGGITNAGAVWILFLNADGTVKSHQKISTTQGNFGGILDNNDIFGWRMNTLGDLDEDSVVDLAVWASDDDGGSNRGAVWILFLNANGTVKSHQKISDTAGNFSGDLDDFDGFGFGVGPLGDLNSDGFLDLAVGATGDDDGGMDSNSNRGAVWILFLQGNGPPSIETITVPLDPVDINNQSFFDIDVAFSVPDGTNNEPFMCEFDIDDDGNIDATTSAVIGTSCSTPLSYAEPGVYTVSVTVTDKDGRSDNATATDFIVIYDPSGGFVTGGGWIISPQGACQFDACNEDTTGKANFGFVSKYKNGASVPTGNTEFQFKAGNLNFHSGVYEWLVVAGPHAKFRGTGTINGDGNYGFMVTATDGQLNGGGGVDGFRIKIWDKEAGDSVVYDNQMGTSDDSNDTTALGGGSIKVHKNN